MRSSFRKAVAIVSLSISMLMSTVAFGLACGDTVTASVTLTEDLTDCPDEGLRVWQRDGIVIDLNGHTISGAKGNASAGIMIFESKASQVIGGSIRGFASGVAVNGSRLITVENVHFSGPGEGVYLLDVQASKVLHNRFDGGFNGVSMVAGDVEAANEVLYNDFLDNTNAVFLRSVHGNRVSHNTFRGNAAAIVLSSASDNEMVGNGIYNNANGIALQQANAASAGSNSNRIEGNKLYQNAIAIGLFAATGSAHWNKYNHIERNAIRGGTTGVDVSGGRNYRTRIERNDFVGVGDGSVDDRGTRTELVANRCDDASC